MNKNTAAVVLAAGYGKRLGGENQKTLIRILGKPVLSYLVSTLKNCCPERIIIVVGFQKEKVMEELKDEPVIFVEQPTLLGTGHAVMMTEKTLSDFSGNVIVLCGDVPFLTYNTIKELHKVHQETGADCTLLTAFFENPTGYGRIIRNPQGSVIKIVEEINASAEEKKIKEINAGVYIFEKTALFDALKRIKMDPVKKEYYLTDVIALFMNDEKKVSSWTTPTPEETIGINTPEDLKKAEEYLFQLRSKV
ncbi:MAG: NTP transferase domain-containing protein [Candidatus Omnitrophica bacterium]|nr:NTP transferase domain-containing protein [Candidatus Omnitrophota bacterium]MCM8816149.1 NTP transferase domain-containing protein [Candidatus Omnitrophota bacterium]